MAFQKTKLAVHVQTEEIVISRVDSTDSDILTHPMIWIKLGHLFDMQATATAAGVTRLVLEIRAVPDCQDGVVGWRPVLCGQFVPGDMPPE